jgi:hypothetical protein
VRDLNIFPANNLVTPRRLDVIEMISQIVERQYLLEFFGLLAPNNIRIPPG